MSELQIGLLAIGAVVVVGVLAYNRWQERGARRDAGRAFGEAHDDVLLGKAPAPEADPVEPAFAPERVADRGEEPQRIAPRFADEPAEAPAADAAVDYIVEFATAEPAAEATVREQWAAIQRRHAPRARLDRREGGPWLAALQLVTRDGPVGEAELIEFRSSVETLAAAVGATASAPEMRAAMDAARELDAVCADADIQVVVHVQGGPFPGTKLRATAEASGLVLEPEGRFAMRNDAGLLLYTLADRDGNPFSAATMKDATPAGLSLALDLGRTPDTRRSFESLSRLANQLAAVLGGRVVDDNGNALDERALGAIGQQLEAVGAQLRARGVVPGSATALRLFS